jgi:beta-N-acetylhexosaminidase
VRIGELFLFGYEPDNFRFLEVFARQNGLGGVIVFNRNCGSYNRLNDELQALTQAAGGKLLISVDQEGGEVVRLKENFPVFPSASFYSRNKDTESLRLSARTTSKYLRQLNINTNLVPVCDVLTNPDNILMRQRSFGADPGIVTEMMAILIDEYKRNGIVTCAKHFPGLGSSEIDPHMSVAVSHDNLSDFENIHWPPFQHAIKNGVDMIMTTHLLTKSLDCDNIATFSKIVVDDILRNKLGFNGVVVTDDLNMGAVAGDYSAGELALLALNAGHDLIMFCHHKNDQESAFKKVLDTYNSGKLDGDEIARKISRIQALKDKL